MPRGSPASATRSWSGSRCWSAAASPASPACSRCTGPIGQLTPTISPGYGYTAIIVAFLGRLSPLGVILAGLLLALSYLGGEAAQIDLGLPSAVTGIFQGVLLFFLLGCDALILYRIKFSEPSVAKASKAPAGPAKAAPL